MWLHHPALQEVLLGAALLFGLAGARFVYRDGAYMQTRRPEGRRVGVGTERA